jgi:hypothetical protein
VISLHVEQADINHLQHVFSVRSGVSYPDKIIYLFIYMYVCASIRKTNFLHFCEPSHDIHIDMQWKV